MSRDKDEDEGVPCESDFEKKVSDAKVRGLKGKILPGTELGSGSETFTGIVILEFVVELWLFSNEGESSIQQITEILACTSPCLHYLPSEPGGCCCCAGLPKAWLYGS